MDRRERLGDLDTTLLAAMAGHQASVWTAMPGIIKDYDATKMTASVQPAIQAQVRNQDGSFSWVNIPLLVDCPVMFPNGGGYSLTFPIEAGDECLVVFASRCIDAWWQMGASNGPQVQSDLRMHDLSDGFVLPGPRSQPRKLSPAPATDGIELRSDDRSSYLKIDDAGKLTAHLAGDVEVVAGGAASVSATGNITASAGGNISATAAGDATVTAPTIHLTGNVTITGNLVVTGNGTVGGTMINNGTNIGKTHVHTGGTLGGGFTGQPT